LENNDLLDNTLIYFMSDVMNWKNSYFIVSKSNLFLFFI
jgi:hypothetical protein